ncbi:hypothetical protein H0H93_003046 [Arthromyces matolae]|nr:hypothetical protein H0H93_003046 [Arthromyces matolae]
MIFIRPILISASLILLALLLVDASPILSSGGLSKENRNALVTSNPSKFSKPQKRSSSKLFARYTDDPYNRVMRQTGKLRDKPDSEDDMVRTIHDVATLIPLIEVGDNNDAKALSERVFGAIANVKTYVLTFKSRKEDVIKDIDTCEAAMLDKGLHPHFDPEVEIITSLKELGTELKATNFRKAVILSHLIRLVQIVPGLLLTKQRTMREKLEAGYLAAKTTICGWEEGREKVDAEILLKKWEGFNSFVNIPTETKSTKRV